MHTTEKVLTRLVEILREDLPGLRAEPGDARGQYFLLYYARLIELLDGALRLAGQTRDAAPVSVLLRSALECSVDLKNLAEQPAYVHVVRAMMLENRSAVFHFRTQPAYGELVELCGKKAVEEMGQRAQNEFRTALKVATQHFPLLKNASRNLNVLNRFRIAGQEELYQTQYTFLSMVTHNDMALMAVREELVAKIAKNPEEGGRQLDFLMIAKYLERIGDHAENIAQWVVFSITGQHNHRQIL